MRRPDFHQNVSELPETAFGPAGLMWWGVVGFMLIEGTTLFVCIALAIKGLDALVPGPPSLVIAAGLTYAVQEWVPGGTAGTAGWLGAAVTLGMLVHAVGDAVTESGAPLLWPVPIRGRTWYPVGGPRVARFRTGGVVESWLVAPALTVGTLVLTVLVVPGVLPVFVAVRDGVQRLLGGA